MDVRTINGLSLTADAKCNELLAIVMSMNNNRLDKKLIPLWCVPVSLNIIGRIFSSERSEKCVDIGKVFDFTGFFFLIVRVHDFEYRRNNRRNLKLSPKTYISRN